LLLLTGNCLASSWGVLLLLLLLQQLWDPVPATVAVLAAALQNS